MAEKKMSEQALHELVTAWGASPSEGGLNHSFRKKLKDYAKSANLTFTQDRSGNIYITLPGRDSSISSICLSFPLDDPTPSRSFPGAIKTFQHLSAQPSRCLTDVTLTGFTSPPPNDRELGLEAWEGNDAALRNAYRYLPELKEFIDQPESDSDEFAFSARLEVEETDGEVVTVSGSSLLVDQARTVINREVTIESGNGPKSQRCAVARVQGKDVVEVAGAMVVRYGEYVRKLFDNFD